MAFSNLGLNEPTPFDPAQANVWATTVNTNMTLLDNAVAGIEPLTVTATDVVLTAQNGAPDQSRNAHFELTGTLTGSRSVFFPNGRTEVFSVFNGTSATASGFSITVAVNNGSSAAAGTTVTVPTGGTLSLASDGTNITQRVDRVGLAAAASGANSDITSLSGLTTPIPISEGGTGASTGAGALSNLGYVPVILHSQEFTSSGTFTVPSTAVPTTAFKITVVGAGGAGGGTGTTVAGIGAGGGAGGSGFGIFTGFSNGDTLTVSIGIGGVGTTTSGNAGNSTSVSYNSNTIANATGGAGGPLNGASSPKTVTPSGGLPGSASFTSAGGATVVSSSVLGSCPGSYGMGFGNDASAGGNGGNSPTGAGGVGATTASGTTGASGGSGARGGGGGGSATENSGSHIGGAGGDGVVIVEWVL